MSARTNLILTDRAGTPVNHTYTPDGDSTNGDHLYSEKTSVPAGNPKFSISLRRSGANYKASLRLAVPIVQTQTISGISTPVVVRTARAQLDFTFSELSSDQERKDLVGLIASALPASQTQINDLVVNLSDIY